MNKGHVKLIHLYAASGKETHPSRASIVLYGIPRIYTKLNFLIYLYHMFYIALLD